MSKYKNKNNIKIFDKDVEEKDFETFSKIEFKPRNDKQKSAWQAIDENAITFLIGSVGSGKTYLATTKALSLLESKQYKKIVLLRPTTIAKKEQLGFLKGSMQDKIEPLILPMRYSMEKSISHTRFDTMVENGAIFPYSLGHIEGISFENSIILFDEFQNTDSDMLRMVMTRIEDSCKLIIMGDKNQIKLDNKAESAAYDIDRYEKRPQIAIIEFEKKDIVRSKICRIVESCWENEIF